LLDSLLQEIEFRIIARSNYHAGNKLLNEVFCEISRNKIIHLKNI